jgi:hypothetical protein
MHTLELPEEKGIQLPLFEGMAWADY